MEYSKLYLFFTPCGGPVLPDRHLGRRSAPSLPVPTPGLPLPVLNLFMVFVGWDFIDGNSEAGRAGGLFNLAAQTAGQRVELRGGQFAHVPLSERRLDPAELLAQRIDPVSGGSQPFFTEGFQFNGLEVLNLELVFPAPGNERGLGDIEFGHEARVAPALGAQFDEALDGFVVVHSRSFPLIPIHSERIRLVRGG